MPFIAYTDPRWELFLSTVQHDVYHLPGYCAIEASLLNGIAVAWYYHNNTNTCLIPLISRTIDEKGQYCDLVSPYGYPGLLSARPLSNNEADMMLALFNNEAREQHYVSSFIRLNPLLNPWSFGIIEGRRQWLHGGTVSVALHPGQDHLRKSFSVNHQRNLKRLERNGYVSSVNDWSNIAAFISAYRQTMRRRNAHPYYFFPDKYFQQLHALLGSKLIYVSVADNEGHFVSGGLFTHFGNVMQYHLGATVDEAMKLSPSKLMMDAVIAYGQANGVARLHLGGGLGGSTTDGLFRFKHGFGRDYHPYSSLRFIHNPAQYIALQLENSGNLKNNDYFPEYRFKTA